jgi:hypothetical protein
MSRQKSVSSSIMSTLLTELARFSIRRFTGGAMAVVFLSIQIYQQIIKLISFFLTFSVENHLHEQHWTGELTKNAREIER